MAKNHASPESPVAKKIIDDAETFVNDYLGQQTRLYIRQLDFTIRHPEKFCQCPQCRGNTKETEKLTKNVVGYLRLLGINNITPELIVKLGKLAPLPSIEEDDGYEFDPESNLCGNCSLYDHCEQSLQNGNQTSPCRYNLL